MLGLIETNINIDLKNVEIRKGWVTPELKKISIEEITAAGGSAHPDGSGGSKS